jgi:tRNA threonylcarbamoyl adenosine modification protein (Sua5/YciO/YrdC/YwlC family)
MPECIEINPYHPRPDLVHELTQAIREGKLVSCPTDTTYGVFASPTDRQAVARLHRLRAHMAGLSEGAKPLRNKPLALVFADLQMLGEHVILSGPAFNLVKRLFPGPYTIILPAARHLPKMLQSRRRNVGARIPDDLLVQSLIEGLGSPVLVTTAKDGEGELVGDAVTLSEAWPNEIDIVVDTGGIVPEPSTVLEVTTNEVVLIREGKGPIDIL